MPSAQQERTRQSTETVPSSIKGLRSYIRVLTNWFYYKDVYYLQTKNVPADGMPLLIVSDHQNSLNDALGILLSVTDRKVRFITRADVFAIHPLIGRFLRWIGLLPAFRLAFEGADALERNRESFKELEEALLDGHTVVMYPEAGHQDKHWLGNFTYGYTRLAFQAAERGGFEKDIYILPSANHYDNYQGLRNRQLIRYGTPISLRPYYDLYKTKPRTAQREVNDLVRGQIRSMMLSIDDLGHYEAIDYIRGSEWGCGYCSGKGLDPERLPDKLASDRELVELLARKGDAALYSETAELLGGMKAEGLRERQFSRTPQMADVVVRIACLVVLAPVGFFCLWPSLISWFVPKFLTDKVGDRMLQGSFVIGLNVLVIFPLAALITLAVAWPTLGLVRALVWVLLIPGICCVEWAYFKFWREAIEDLRWLRAEKAGRTAALAQRRRRIFGRLDGMVRSGDDKDNDAKTTGYAE